MDVMSTILEAGAAVALAVFAILMLNRTHENAAARLGQMYEQEREDKLFLLNTLVEYGRREAAHTQVIDEMVDEVREFHAHIDGRNSIRTQMAKDERG